jgi:short-subunit dehydrogenase
MKVLITGASRGIGFAEAKEFKDDELFLVASSLDSFKDDFFKGKNLFGYDLRSSDNVIKLAEEIKSKTDKIDLLINNVGIITLKRFEDMSVDEINSQIDLNLKSHILLTKELLPLLMKSENPHIIFMSSMAAKTGVIGETVYAATKAGISKFAEILRKELQGRINVSVIHSWGVNTFGSKVESLLKPEDVAKVVRFIVSNKFLVESIEIGHPLQWRGGKAPWSP